MIPVGVAERLQTHAAAVVASASVPSSERDELTEELHGHLLERCRALVDSGMDPSLAADQAIDDFGSADRIGRDLTRTYRGRLWASTIGVLLPAVAVPARPLPVSLMAGLSFVMAAIYALVSILTVLNSPPLHAVLLGVGGILPAIGAWILGLGLLRAQRWALVIGVAGCAALTVVGLYDLTRHTFSLSGAWAALALVTYVVDRRQVHHWLVPMPVPRRAVAGLAVLLATPLLGGPVSLIPDPTQAGPADLSLAGSMDCGAVAGVPAETADGKRYETDEPAIVVSVEFTWDRTSLLPGGIVGNAPVDNLVIEGMPVDWVMLHDSLTDVSTGEDVPGSGGLGPGGPATMEERSWSAAIPRAEIRPGRTIRFQVTLVDPYHGPRTLPLPTEPARASYWHASAFVETIELSCPG